MFTIAFGIVLGYIAILTFNRIMNSATVAVLRDLPEQMRIQALHEQYQAAARIANAKEKLVQIKPNQFRVSK